MVASATLPRCNFLNHELTLGHRGGTFRDPRWSPDIEADSILRAVMGTAPAEDYAPIDRNQLTRSYLIGYITNQ